LRKMIGKRILLAAADESRQHKKNGGYVMKKLSWLLMLAMLVSMIATLPASAETAYIQSPVLDAKVESGELPPVEERLPENPLISKEILDEYLEQEVGKHGGTLRMATNSVNWDADVFVGMDEGILLMESSNSEVITPNVVESYEVNEDNTVFTFTLRKGLKWSDGTELTMEDVAFAINHFVFNEELTPVIPAYMRDGGTDAGDPFTFEVIDDLTFSLSFKESYGGFVVHLSIAGWKGYTELMKPAYFLKPYHIAYAEEIHGSLEAYYAFMQPYATAMGYDDVTEEGVWCYVFNQMDCTNWECTDPTDTMPNTYFTDVEGCPASFPQLYPWIMVSSDNGVTIWERNPYYFKVDAGGLQLPYFDTVVSTYTEDAELVQFSVMSGDVDFMREAATINNISMYRENAETAGIVAYTTGLHTTSGEISVNHNYGMNNDGTVKDDDVSRAWQEVINDEENRFLRALCLAIDADEAIDAVYNGLAEKNSYFDCDGDLDGAMALLDEMGMIDIDGDGFRETPSGLPFYFNLYAPTSSSNLDTMACSELYYEYWTEIGIKVFIQPADATLLGTMVEANEVEMRAGWTHSHNLWHYQEWQVNMPLWRNWVNEGGLSGKLEGSTEHAEPTEAYKAWTLGIQGCFTVDPETAVNVNVPELRQMNAENIWQICPYETIQQCVVINSDIRNVPTGGIGISWNFALPQMYYDNPEQH
jgi:peptide/nickel transport system substrate-binding protein